MTYGVLVECDVCKDTYDLSDFFFSRCGHGLCPNCNRKLKKEPKCVYCREPKGDYQPHPIFVSLNAPAPKPPKTVAEGIDRIGVDTPAVSVERASRELKRALARNLSDNTKSELLEALQRLEQRTLPFYMELEKNKLENKSLRKDVGALERRLNEVDNLQGEVSQLRDELTEAQSQAETNMALAKSAREQLIRETEERQQLGRTVQRQHITLRKRDAELEELRRALEESERKRRVAQTKLKALAKPLKASSKKPVQDPDDSLIVEPPILDGLSPVSTKKRRRHTQTSS